MFFFGSKVSFGWRQDSHDRIRYATIDSHSRKSVPNLANKWQSYFQARPRPYQRPSTIYDPVSFEDGRRIIVNANTLAKCNVECSVYDIDHQDSQRVIHCDVRLSGVG